MARHDRSYKLLFSHPEMVRSLLCGFIHERWIPLIDFDTLEHAGSGSQVSEDLRERAHDMIWRARWRGSDRYVYLLLEFQSSPDRRMALRILTYVSLLYQDLAKRQNVSDTESLPAVVPVVLYKRFQTMDRFGDTEYSYSECSTCAAQISPGNSVHTDRSASRPWRTPHRFR